MRLDRRALAVIFVSVLAAGAAFLVARSIAQDEPEPTAPARALPGVPQPASQQVAGFDRPSTPPALRPKHRNPSPGQQSGPRIERPVDPPPALTDPGGGQQRVQPPPDEPRDTTPPPPPSVIVGE